MRTPALAIASSIWYRHRQGLIVAAVMLLAMAIVCPLLLRYSHAPAVMIACAAPNAIVLAYVLNALLFVEEAGSMSSSYPRHMLTLPVRTQTLAFWPILYASTVAALLWLVSGSIYRLGGLQAPLVLPALGLAAFIAWCQTLSWVPIRSPWLRTAVALGSIFVLGALPFWLGMFDPFSPARLAALLIGYWVAAYAVGLAALVNDRRGDVWRIWPARFRPARIASRSARVSRGRPFRTPAAAQLWYEWNCHGLALPLFAGALIVLFVATKLWFGPQTESYQVPLTLGVFLGMPAVVAGSASTIYGRLRPVGVDDRRFVTFLAIRPLNSGNLVAAKFRMALVSALLSWAIAVTGTVFWIFASQETASVAALARDFFERYPGGRGVTTLILAGVLMPALIWRLLTDWLAPSLTGRRWIAETGACVYAVLIAGLALGGVVLMNRPEDRPLFLAAVPWLVVGAALFKGSLAIATFKCALRWRLMSWRVFWGILVMWLALSFCAVALAALVIPSAALPVSWPILSLGIATLVPMARFPLATLAFDWNRHR
jgi:hypothetical protein